MSDESAVDSSDFGADEFMSQSECDSILETLYLLSIPANRAWLMQSIAQAKRGELIPYSWAGDTEK